MAEDGAALVKELRASPQMDCTDDQLSKLALMRRAADLIEQKLIGHCSVVSGNVARFYLDEQSTGDQQ